MKVAVICYHKNLADLYPATWVEQYRNSILGQSFQELTIYEVNYGAGEERIFNYSNYESIKFPTFIHAMNYLLDKVFDDGFDCAGNSNVDDVYAKDWLSTLVPYIEQMADIASCNFALVKDDAPYHYHHFDTLDIREELKKDHNIIAHPAVLYSRKFWKTNRYNPEEFPEEDLKLWKRAITNYKFAIAPENLLFHRVHSNSVCQSENR